MRRSRFTASVGRATRLRRSRAVPRLATARRIRRSVSAEVATPTRVPTPNQNRRRRIKGPPRVQRVAALHRLDVREVVVVRYDYDYACEYDDNNDADCYYDYDCGDAPAR